MKRHGLIVGALGLGVLALAPTQGQAAAYSRAAALPGWDASDRLAVPAQHWRRGGGPRFHGGRPYAGRPYWGHRTWARRPYYGTVIAGVVLGTIVTVAAVGMIPRRPAPDLCWYWADPYQNRGYWDYCY
jgi:hypothetical protein